MVSANTVKVQPITCHEGRWGVEVQIYSFFNLSAKSGQVVNAMRRSLYPQEWPSIHYVRRLGGSQGQFGLVWKILPPTRIPP